MRIVAAVLLLSCTPALAQSRGRPPNFKVPAEQRKELLAGIEQQLRDHYIFPERLEAALPQLRARWATLEKDDAHALTDQINAVYEALIAAVDRYGGAVIGLFPALVKADVLPGNVGYLEVIAFPAGARQAYAPAMAFLQDTEALIVDLRNNGGGEGDSVADLLGYLLDRKTLLGWDIERDGKKLEHFSSEKVDGPRYGEKRPVFVLTSQRTFSAAEAFAYQSQSLKRATVVGEVTPGGANHNRIYRLGDFALSVPYMTTRNAVTGANWESGVQPDVKVSADAALKTAQRIAVEKQLAVEQDPGRKARLEHLAADLR